MPLPWSAEVKGVHHIALALNSPLNVICEAVMQMFDSLYTALLPELDHSTRGMLTHFQILL